MGDLTTNLLSAVAGGVATWLVSWWTRRTATLGHWGAFLAELEICRDAAAAFLADEVQAPLGRLPMMAFNRAFPILIENGRMRPSQVRALTELYSVADWKNRSLEPTQSYVAGPLRDDGLLPTSPRFQ